MHTTNPTTTGNGNPNTGPALVRAWALRANLGIRLTLCPGGRLPASPLGPDGQPNPQVLVLPKVAARLVERGAGFLRHVWQARGTSAAWWLYVHPGQYRWWMYCPPQLCAEVEVEADATFKDCATPDPDLWLAGCLRSVPPGVNADDPQEVGPLLPPHEGVHLVLDLARPLTCVAAYLRTERGVEPAAAQDLIDDPLDPDLAYLSDRLMFRTPSAATTSIPPPTPLSRNPAV